HVAAGSMTMNLDELNTRVTELIYRAKNLQEGLERTQVFHDISVCEEQIAKLLGANLLDGRLARLGAVTAAISANDPRRAVELATTYIAEPQQDKELLRLLKNFKKVAEGIA